MVAIPLFLIFIVSVLLVFDTKKGILAAVVVRPLIDCFWEAKYDFLALRPTEILGVVLPILIFFKIIISQENKIFRTPLAFTFGIYTFYQLLPILFVASEEGSLKSLSMYFRILHGFLGFIVFQELYIKIFWVE